ncbi:hypothetical protein LEMLEM_LOCUS11860 [Lemmus lemmus]
MLLLKGPADQQGPADHLVRHLLTQQLLVESLLCTDAAVAQTTEVFKPTAVLDEGFAVNKRDEEVEHMEGVISEGKKTFP